MDICVLSTEEVGRLTHYKLSPNHDEHVHISPAEALKGLKEESLEMVGERYVTRSKCYFLQRKPSAGIDCIQRVLSNHILELKPVR